MRTILQEFHRWRLGITDPQPLELPNRSVVNRRYQILCQLGQGSVERTYLAEDRYLKGSWCVLKEFVPRLLNPRALAEGRERFEQEVSLLRDLEHPQLPEFREVLECQFDGLNRWIVVQEWLEGMSYLDLVKSRPFTESDVIQFLKEVLPALNYLHQQEPPVVHGNLSAETILHSSEMDKPILINFGTLKHIALCIADPYADPVAPRLRPYRPSEQLNGQLNATTDLYALAVTALTMLTGCADPREFYDRRRGTWTWSEHAAASLGLVVILDRMLHPDPAARYQSGIEVQAALDAIHSRLPVPKPEPPALLLPSVERPAGQTAGQTAKKSGLVTRLSASLIGAPAKARLNASGDRVSGDVDKENAARLLMPSPSLARVNQTVTVAVRQASSVVVAGLVGGLQRSGSGVRSQWGKFRRVPPQKVANVAVGTATWLFIALFLGLTAYGSGRLWRRLRSDLPAGSVAASVKSAQEEAQTSSQTSNRSSSRRSSQGFFAPNSDPKTDQKSERGWLRNAWGEDDSERRSRFLNARDLDRCDVGLARRFHRLEQGSWVAVDDEFQLGFPNFSGPIDVYNPDHAFYLQEWCYLANRWLGDQGI